MEKEIDGKDYLFNLVLLRLRDDKDAPDSYEDIIQNFKYLFAWSRQELEEFRDDYESKNSPEERLLVTVLSDLPADRDEANKYWVTVEILTTRDEIGW